jgi:hypothetical protein
VVGDILIGDLLLGVVWSVFWVSDLLLEVACMEFCFSCLGFFPFQAIDRSFARQGTTHVLAGDVCGGTGMALGGSVLELCRTHQRLDARHSFRCLSISRGIGRWPVLCFCRMNQTCPNHARNPPAKDAGENRRRIPGGGRASGL